MAELQHVLTVAQHGDVAHPLDSFVQNILDEYHIPGLAVGVINGNETWTKGYGFAKLPSTPMTPSHLFYCGSTTKSFTAAAMSLLVDDNDSFPQVQWTTPMSSLIRDDFVLSDNWATEHITVEDALSHRTGYPGHTMGIDNKSPRECVRRLRHLPMSAEPRTVWQYSNYMFTAVGHVVETLTGSWLGEFFRERLWEPMGMNSTFLRREDAEADGRHELTTEYWWDEETQAHVNVPHLPDGRGREGAGMVISNVEDYLRYLRVMMDESLPISKAGHTALKTGRMLMPQSSPHETPQFYALGWSGGVTHGCNFWTHNGRIREHVTDMWIVPERRLAFVVLINANQPAAVSEISKRILAHYIGREESQEAGEDGSKASQKLAEKRLTSAGCKRDLYPQLPDLPLPRPVPLDQYAGSYHDAGYGTFKLSLEEADESMPNSSENPERLVTDPKMGFDGLTFRLVLEHVSGDYWLAWAYVLEHVSSGFAPRPESCIRAQTQLGADGRVHRIGLDLRQESKDGPLVWFDRVEQDAFKSRE